jgi:hypothetical protein
MKYVIHLQAIPDPAAVYVTKYEQRIAVAPLRGPEFDHDNAKVYGILKQLCLEGQGRAYILPFDATQNGHGACLALHNHFESDTFRNHSKNDAYLMGDQNII